MKKFILGAALAAMLPMAAHAQSAPVPKQGCCEKMKAEGKKCCCDDMANKDHAEHDMSSMDHSKK